MFPFRPSRTVTALLELAEAMLAPEAFGGVPDEGPAPDEHAEPTRHPHRRAAIERRRRPAPAKPEQACLTPLARPGRARETQRA